MSKRTSRHLFLVRFADISFQLIVIAASVHVSMSELDGRPLLIS